MNDDDDTKQRHLWLIGLEWIWNRNDWKVILFERHMKIDLYNVEMWQNTYINVISLHRKMSALYEDDNDVHHCLNS